MDSSYGKVMLDIKGTNLSDEDKNLISNKHVGGLILFSRNFESYNQLKTLIKQIKSVKKNILISVDQEGGRVQRLDGEFTSIPSMREIANFALKNNDYKIFREIGWLISSELLSVGIDLNFAPVLDIDEKNSSIIGDRSFSKDIDEIIKCSSFFIDGMHEAGMKSVGKHFPGHGGVYEDSHLKLPIDQKKLSDLLIHEISPYIALKNKLDAVMCAHILFRNVDTVIPSFSKKWIKNILKERIGYKGIIFSDDLSMKGAGNESCVTKSIKSLDAGCDMVIICNDRDGVKDVLNHFDENNFELTNKLSAIKKANEVCWNELKENKRAISIKNKLNKIRS